MDIEYKSTKLEKECTDKRKSRTVYGDKIAERIEQRLNQITAADSVETMLKFKIGRCHKLNGNRSDEYALDLVHPHRLILKEVEGKIKVVMITEIVDYH